MPKEIQETVQLSPMLGLAVILVIGIASQWFAWRIRVPSILILLLSGILVGPVLGWVQPVALFGSALTPIVSFSVALILFEGGLSLNFRELKDINRTLWLLVLIGGVATWLLSALLAWTVLGFDVELALLLGAILIVTGPTVVGPILRQIRPTGPAGRLIKWEGIVIDPIGAMFAVLVFDAILEGEHGGAPWLIASGILKTVLAGVIFGWVGAWGLATLYARRWVPDELDNPVAVATVLLAFVCSNAIQNESGLFTVTLMGVLLANWPKIDIKHIVEFKENLRVFLISGLFIILTSPITVTDIRSLTLYHGIFLVLLILVVRPASVLLSIGLSKLNWRDMALVMSLAPRGIVAASVATIFSHRLEQAGLVGASELVPTVFLVVAGTVAIYGLGAGQIALQLGLSVPNPQGFLIIGAHDWVRKVAIALRDSGVKVQVADTNWRNVSAARMEGLDTYYGNVLSSRSRDELDLVGIGNVIAMTPNDDANSLCALNFAGILGRSHGFQLAESKANQKRPDSQPHSHLRGREVWNSGLDFTELQKRFRDGYFVKVTTLTDSYGFDDFQRHYTSDACVLFVLGPSAGDVRVQLPDSTAKPRTGQKIIALIPPARDEIESSS